MFIDETRITVLSGRGGYGLVSFRREKYIPRGGPDGGDGGRGGHVVLRAVSNLTTLARIQHGRTYRADNGGPGGTANKHGANGDDLLIELPVGTLVRDAEQGHVLRDLVEAGDEVIIARGGNGGRGNKSYASSTNRTPRKATEGRPGESRKLRFELRLVADAGLVGLPNAGKSTFLARVSAARPKVADYPFTTLEPMLGLVDLGDESLVLADIPGLIDGAHSGAGLGDRFLRHVARTCVLLHVVDGTVGPEAAVEDWATIRRELELSGLDLHQKPGLLAVTKGDAMTDPDAVLDALEKASGERPLLISSQSGIGVPEVLAGLARLVQLAREEEAMQRVAAPGPSALEPLSDPGKQPGGKTEGSSASKNPSVEPGSTPGHAGPLADDT